MDEQTRWYRRSENSMIIPRDVERIMSVARVSSGFIAMDFVLYEVQNDWARRVCAITAEQYAYMRSRNAVRYDI